MLDGLKKLFGGGEEPAKGAPGRRVTPKGECAVIVEGRRYQLKNWNTEGFAFGPASRDITAGKRIRVDIVV
jgi:hypothetical protein